MKFIEEPKEPPKRSQLPLTDEDYQLTFKDYEILSKKMDKKRIYIFYMVYKDDLEQSQELKDILQDYDVQELIRSIDSSIDPMMSLEQSMSHPQLAKLLNCIRDMINPGSK
jgi:hypothetical protein